MGFHAVSVNNLSLAGPDEIRARGRLDLIRNPVLLAKMISTLDHSSDCH